MIAAQNLPLPLSLAYSKTIKSCLSKARGFLSDVADDFLFYWIFIKFYREVLSVDLNTIHNMYSWNEPAVVVDRVLQMVPVNISYSLISSD